MPETAWEATKKYSVSAYTKALKPGLEKVYETVDKFDNHFSVAPGTSRTEGSRVASLDQEFHTAALVLRSFCNHGFHSKVGREQIQEGLVAGDQLGASSKQQSVLTKIPVQVIRDAKGLVVFTITSTDGLLDDDVSGVLVRRDQESGKWSTPYSAKLQEARLELMEQLDVYDGVTVINTYEALDIVTRAGSTPGGDLDTVTGPLALEGNLDIQACKRQEPMWMYLKARGLDAGVQIEGTAAIKSIDSYEISRGGPISGPDILAGKAGSLAKERYRMLLETIVAAQGDSVEELRAFALEPSPTDVRIETDFRLFGLPDAEDPDPYGVKALQAEGLQIREAGTQSRPRPGTFSFSPVTTSPIYPNFRKSMEMRQKADSWRGSTQSIASVGKVTQTSDAGVRSPSHSPSKRAISQSNSMGRVAELAEAHTDPTGDQADGSKGKPKGEQEDNREDEPDHEQEHEAKGGKGEVAELEEAAKDVESDGDEDFYEVKDLNSSAEQIPEIRTAIPVVARARMVSVPKRVPPAIPPRNPDRKSASRDAQEDVNGLDTASLDGVGQSDSADGPPRSDLESKS